MTYQELFDKLTPEQMQQEIIIFTEDEGTARLQIEVEISEEDMYWEHDECQGNLEQVKADNPDDWEEIIEDLVIVPKGSVSIQILD